MVLLFEAEFEAIHNPLLVTVAGIFPTLSQYDKAIALKHKLMLHIHRGAESAKLFQLPASIKTPISPWCRYISAPQNGLSYHYRVSQPSFVIRGKNIESKSHLELPAIEPAWMREIISADSREAERCKRLIADQKIMHLWIALSCDPKRHI